MTRSWLVNLKAGLVLVAALSFVWVLNASAPPAVTWLSPNADMMTVSATTTLAAMAVDDGEVVVGYFKIDGAASWLTNFSPTNPWPKSGTLYLLLNTLTMGEGPHTIAAVVCDLTQCGETPTRTVIVKNLVRDGVDGAPGPPGRDGTNGTNGVDGRDGVDGAPGAKGDKGDPCLAIDPACRGPQGLPGPAGVGFVKDAFLELPVGAPAPAGFVLVGPATKQIAGGLKIAVNVYKKQ